MSPRQIKEARQKLEITQVQFALLVGVHPITFTRWETGAYVPTAWQSALVQRVAETKLRGARIRSLLQQYSPVDVLARLL